MKKITVLHCFGKMNIGGAETMLMNIYRHLDREKYQFDFLVFQSGEGLYDKEIEELGGHIYILPNISNVGIIKYIRNLIGFFNSHPQYQIIHSHMDWIGGYIALAAAFAKKKKRIVHAHAVQSVFQDSFMKKIAISLSKILIELFATDKFACSREAADNLFLSKKEAYLIKNAIDLGTFIKKPEMDLFKEYQIQDDTLILGHVGSFSENKNQGFLIELVDILRKKGKKVILFLIGRESELCEQLKQRVRELSLEEQIIFTGVKTNIADYMNQFDMFLFPSYSEGLGIVAIEAQAARCQCLISDTIPTEVDMGLGLVTFLKLDDKEKWIDKIENYEKNTLSKEDIYRVMVRNGYDIKNSTKEIEEIYQGMQC